MADPTHATQATYDQVAGEFRAHWSHTWPELSADLDTFAARLPRGARIADVGCGPGRDVRELRHRGFEVIGLDLSSGMLAASDLTGLARADMRTLPLQTGAVDGVWCQAALLHVVREDVPRVVFEFARVVRPGGPLYLTVSEGTGEGWETGAYGGGARWFVHHRADTLTSLVEAAGFSVVWTQRWSSHRSWLNMLAEHR